MAENHKVQVVLLDDRKLTFNVQPKMYTCDLFDIVSSHFNLKEKEYFGLYYLDESSNQQWLQTDRKVLDHDLSKKTDPILLYFAVRFYIENMYYLQDSVSVELYYMQARQSVYKGVIECDSSTVFELAAYALQIAQGSLIRDGQVREALKKVPVFPASTFSDHPSIQYCEDQVLKRYYAINGITRGQAMVSYMSVVEKLPTYGIHYYEVKNKQGISSWLGLSFKGIAQFDYSDKRVARKVFPWKYLENLYFRDKKFSIEVHDPKRVSVSRRTFGPSNVNVYAWFTNKPQLTKCIWSMAVCQHQFFLDRLQNKSTLMIKRCPNVIADELSLPRTQSLQTLNHMNSHVSLQESALNTLNMSKTGSSKSTTELTPEQLAKQKELYKGLDERKNKLETVLQDKIKQLKSLCLQESEITGELPHEYTLFMCPGEKTPVVKKRVGTSFSIADLVSGKVSDLTKLEMEYEVQKQILKAKQKLANDETLSKNVRKKHNADYMEARSKLKELSHRLNTVRNQAGLDTGSLTSDDTTSLGSIGPSPGPVRSPTSRSPKKSLSSQQLESLEYSPSSRRRINSGSRLQSSHKSSSARSFEIASNPSSSSSLASLSLLDGHNEFTPTKALKYTRPVMSTPTAGGGMPVVHSAADLHSVGSGTTSTSSLHAYSVSNGRPLRSGSMDDVRLAAGNGSVTGQPSNAQYNDRAPNHHGTTQRSKAYLASNPYGSLERKALKQRRIVNRGEHDSSTGSSPHGPNPYIPNASYKINSDTYNYRLHRGVSAEHRHSEAAPPIPAARGSQGPPHPLIRSHGNSHHPHHPQHHYPNPHHYHMDREYANNVQQASRRMYNTSQPFQMLDNPYNTHSRNMDMLSNSMSTNHITPINIDANATVHSQLPLPPPRRSSVEQQYADSSSQNSPQENAFSFFTTLSQLHSAANNNLYQKQTASGDGRVQRDRSFSQEETKPYEMKDYYQYSERLRRAKGMGAASSRPPSRPPAAPPQPAARSFSSRTTSNSSLSMEGSRSGSPYNVDTLNPPSYSNDSRSTVASSHIYANLHQPGFTGTLTSQTPTHPRRSMVGGKDSSFNTGDVADNFSQEMLAWYQDKDSDQQSSTLV